MKGSKYLIVYFTRIDPPLNSIFQFKREMITFVGNGLHAT